MTTENKLEYPIGIESVQHPFQPLYLTSSEENAVLRFKKNNIIDYLFTSGKLDLNAIMGMGFPVEDYEQLAQLLGYSHSGFGSLSYVRNETWYGAREASKGHDSMLMARYTALTKELADIKAIIKKHRDELDELLPYE